jgi:hypothetical protein
MYLMDHTDIWEPANLGGLCLAETAPASASRVWHLLQWLSIAIELLFLSGSGATV